MRNTEEKKENTTRGFFGIYTEGEEPGDGGAGGER